ncbi:putative dehydratase [Luminiphilus syltensis NOR5-1B]|uniref:Putative dehydratase n=1 Tax=Luminiphilus syltensis NOR5-1B TaxID=565045 RepID=B8KTJ4_9GAMM|nr:MmgE/PrpD family protein [Luminiphilus syltensis]EED35108.1 putative dehydratase [Luminiphilus syltensis NOR5-1B]
MGVTSDLAKFAVDITYESLPDDVVETIKCGTLNILGTCLGGLETRNGGLHVELAKELGVAPESSSIIGDGTKVSVPFAAYANGSLGFALDYEDMLYYIYHPGYICFAAACAVGEPKNITGKDFITAMAVGYEVGGRIGIAMQPSAERSAEVWGEQYTPIGAAVTAGKILGLSAEEMEVAMGIAGTYSTVPSVHKYFGMVSETRPMREVKMGWGWMCMAGVMAALSAKKGFAGGKGILDGEQGFWVMAGSDRCDFDRMVEGLGSHWMTPDTEYKIHPSIGFNHPAYWATVELVDGHSITPEDVASVEIQTFWSASIGDTDPRREVDAMFSIPYTVCSTIMRLPLTPDLYSEDTINNPELRRLLSVTEVQSDPEADVLFSDEQRLKQRVAITMNNGDCHERVIIFPDDKPEYGRNEIIGKFRLLASTRLSEAVISEAEKRVLELELESDVAELIKLTSG